MDWVLYLLMAFFIGFGFLSFVYKHPKVVTYAFTVIFCIVTGFGCYQILMSTLKAIGGQ